MNNFNNNDFGNLDIGIGDFKREVMKANYQKQTGLLLSYENAMEDLKELMKDEITERMEQKATLQKKLKDVNIVKKDKEYLRKEKKEYEKMIKECIAKNSIRVKNYEGEKINQFIQEMVGEFVGYSVLEDAFADPSITDIYVIDWETIFVEKNGVNERYHKNFRSPKHFENVLKRFLSEAGKEINIGDSKIVDFELYQDRGCAISPAVSPRGYLLTIRKHSEDHIVREQLIENKVMDEKMSDLLGMLIIGECNLICGGITGSGKTTTIRALLDYYVTKANKRMIVCEDTQELFPQNEHTLELVSVKSDDKNLAIPLQNLIYTALRLKPKYIVVGEVRAEEAEAAVEGMETGHSTIFTMHGGVPINIINRLVTKYLMAMPTLSIDVVERIIGSAVDYIFIQDNIPGIGRKITTLTEVNYNFETRRVELIDICTFDFETETWIWHNKLGKDKIDKMLRRGIPYKELKPWIRKY